jgi:RND family efflux transporter MFP subunit
MSPSRQIAIAAVVLVAVAAGWLVYERGWLGSAAVPRIGQGEEATPSANRQQGGGQGNQTAPAGNRNGQGAGSARGGPPVVVTAAVTTDTAGVHVTAVGTVAAVRAVTLYPQVTGLVAGVSFASGASVGEGEVLLHLDDADKQVAVEQAQIALDTARRALDRAEQLVKSNNVTPVAVADAETAVRKAEIDLRGAQVELDKYTVKAPFAGTIGLSDVSVGDFVTSQRAIATLDDMSTVTVSFDVPERASGLVAVGQAVTATTEALAGQTFAGTVTAVDSRVDPVARTLKVEASLPNDASRLKPGMALIVAIDFPGEEHPVVSSLSVQWDRNGPYVWKVVDDTVHRVRVTIVSRRSGTVLVSGDLAAGDEVVTEGLQRMRDGIAVAPGGAGAQSGGRNSGAGAEAGGAVPRS